MITNTPSKIADYDPITLSLFSNRFMCIAEAMGRSLKQTAISTNIKERLDFSCAVFSPSGDLVANAPFVPVHLGSMSWSVKYQLKLHGKNLKDGDVILTNSPMAGGSHLPDLTVITPCFDQDDPTKIIFFTASRGHHSDIGGILPGSMPPTSTQLYEEGANIHSLKIVSDGYYDHDALHRVMVEEPSQYPGCSGSRSFRDVESDVKAQIAANNKGTSLLRALVKEYDLETVHRYMDHIRNNAEQAVRNMLRKAAEKAGTNVLHAVDYLDDGSPIALKITIDTDTGSAVFDFEGTGPELRGNLNAPICVVHAAVIYCMRSMIGEDIPLNAGCLVPIEIKIPEGCLLSPSPESAVCGGNVMTSQRITDTVLLAFKACAASQGCCNNLTFGAGGKDSETGEVIDGWGYYETIAGGSGAGDGWHGTSGVHCHMTNTRITDPEILERRYPVILHEFGFRPASGGVGKYQGGEGCIRSLQFLQPLSVSILSERRSRAPYGLNGGGPGATGLNLWIKQPKGNKDDKNAKVRTINVGGKGTMQFGTGDYLILHTPGGGGYGSPEDGEDVDEREEERLHIQAREWEARGSWADKAQPDF
ncbi:cytoplasmic protein [Kwoniella heveanensis CBS 569]|uniref:Cytoplasmic protein n=1 Tax=Kwoniella heveanensis BCC8398 TaxID=1296120 RepID=A0A1B9GSA4_9TREE|nr:cytoplasmic protein [Kwoniella heveanensis BCC8398]OCF41598.1 cytoplasmic protein [Kwoniella heveanensis CBS 569]